MKDLTLGFIGLGLIGGSIARSIKKKAPNTKIMAYTTDKYNLAVAHEEGIVNVVLDDVDERLSECDIIFLCTPVGYNSVYLEKIKPFAKKGGIITDVGSTKTAIHELAAKLDMEDMFIGGHPMAGSERGGYENSNDHLLENVYYVISPTEKTSEENIKLMIEFTESIGSIPLVLDYKKHDYTVAAISHLPHVIASSLVNLVHDCDEEDHLMKRLAAGGFKDITRIASASPVMWEHICTTNEANISLVLEKYIESLQKISAQIKHKEKAAIRDMFESSRKYRNSFGDTGSGLISGSYEFSVDILDEPGAIAIISAIMAGKGISIKNIGINHNRENDEGALRISFYDEEAKKAAWDRLKAFNYKLFE